MRINMKRLGECVTLEAEGTPEEMATYSRLAGLVPSQPVGADVLKSFLTSIGFDSRASDARVVAAVSAASTSDIAKHLR